MENKAMDIYNELQNSIKFKQSEQLEEKCRRNERFFSGDQWNGVVSNGLPLIVYNFLKQIVLAKVSIISANRLAIKYTADDTSTGDEEVERAASILNAEAKRTWKRLKLDYENQITLLDAAITGIGATYWYWDDNIKSGNKVRTEGDMCFEHVDVSEIHFANPRECDIQRQDFILIAKRKSVKKVKQLAENAGISKKLIAEIKPEKDDSENYFDKKENDTYEGNNVTLIYKFYKKNGTVHWSLSTQNVMIKDEIDTGFKIYPIAMMNWDTRKKFIYGEAEITYMIPNQIAVNKLASLRHANALLFGSPKILIDTSRISKFDNKVGGVIGVNGSVREAYTYIQPESMGSDVDKSLNENINLTKETASVNDNLLGASRPENTSAIMLQQKQSSIPLDLNRYRYYDYLEQVGRIIREFVVNQYQTDRLVRTSEDSEEMVQYSGTELADIYLETYIDVGESTQWSEVISSQVIDKLLERKDIDIIQAIERYPKNIIPDQQKLIDELKKAKEQAANIQNQALQQQQTMTQPQPLPAEQPTEQPLPKESMNMEFSVEEMIEFVKLLPMDIQKILGQIGEEERIDVVQQMMVASPDELKSVFEQLRS